jgi:hypothetical protein
LANQSPATGSDRGANGELFFTRGGSGQQEIGDVAAADQKQKRYRSQNDVEGGAKLADDQVGQRLDLDRKVLRVLLGIFGGELCGNYGQVRFGLLDRNAALQMT